MKFNINLNDEEMRLLICGLCEYLVYLEEYSQSDHKESMILEVIQLVNKMEEIHLCKNHA